MAERVRMLPAGKLDQAAFVQRFGGVVEHSPWVAEAAWNWRPFRDFDALHLAFDAALMAAPESAQVAVLQAHPDLAVDGPAVTASLTAESRGEQAGAGLDKLTEDRRAELAGTLAAYRAKFDFPFIICVRDHGGEGIDELALARAENPREAELQTALNEVSAIARHRLADLVAEDQR
jgi:2-oxo-4-hydroxy-4-carboxy-5-ureidoimidazoline decarboxylase